MCVCVVCVAGSLEYQAQSPDEGALVSAARNFGFVFLVMSTLSHEKYTELIFILMLESSDYEYYMYLTKYIGFNVLLHSICIAYLTFDHSF